MKTTRRELLQLAKPFDANKHDVIGWYMSTKLDGTRAFWDGGVTRGLETTTVPWASIIDPKTGDRKAKIKPTSTGLWSRYGNPIVAPDWFLDQLPMLPCDGELWAGPGSFQQCRSAVATDVPIDSRWRDIKFHVFDIPPFEKILQVGLIKGTNQLTEFTDEKLREWAPQAPEVGMADEEPFRIVVDNMESLADLHGDCSLFLPQTPLESMDQLWSELDAIVSAGGEGLMLREPESFWVPQRNASILKVKPHRDDEGTLVGFTSGRKTNKGSKFLGKIGALILDYNGKRLELSGLTDAERELSAGSEYATNHPGEDMPSDVEAVHFKRGDLISFKYMTLTKDDIPREARYFRKRDVDA